MSPIAEEGSWSEGALLGAGVFSGAIRGIDVSQNGARMPSVLAHSIVSHHGVSRCEFTEEGGGVVARRTRPRRGGHSL